METPSPEPSPSPSPRPATRPRGRALAWLAGLLPLLIVVGAILSYVWWWQPAADTPHGHTAAPAPAPSRVEAERDYYVFVRTLEVYPKQPGGGTWDRGGGSAPDLWYRLVWRESTVHESKVVDDAFIALWDPISIDVREALLGSGEVELASTLNKGGVINVTAGETLTLQVYDSDPVGREHAGTAHFEIDTLLEGENTFTFEASDENAVKRVVMTVSRTDHPVANLLDALKAP